MRRTYTREFKLECCQQVVTAQKRPAQICPEHNLAQSVLLRWRREYEARGQAAFTEKQLSQTEALEGAQGRRAGALLRQARPGERDPKKGAGQIPLGQRHAMIEEAKGEHPRTPLSDLCELFGVSRSWYYKKQPSPEEKASEDVELRDATERIVLEFPGYDGYRRVTQTLKRQGWTINHKKVLGVMRKESLLCQLKRGFKPTTDSSHSLKTYPNLIKGTAAVDAPDRAWSVDITYVRLPTSFCYLASIIDEYSR